MPRIARLVIPAAVLAVVGWYAFDHAFGVRPYTPPLPPGDPPAARPGFAGPAPPDDWPVHPLLPGYFARFTGTPDAVELAADLRTAFDTDKLLDEARAADTAGTAPLPKTGTGLREATQEAVVRVLSAGGLGPPPARIVVVRVVPLPGGEDVIALTRHESAAGSFPVRWWMTFDGRLWRAFDVEDARLGLRLSEQVAYALAGRPNADAVGHLDRAAAAVAKADFPAAARHLDAARGAKLPRGLRVMARVLDGSTALGLGRPADALAAAAEISRLRPGTPAAELLRAGAYLRTREFAAAAAAARAYQAAVGPDPQAAIVLGTALLGMNDAAGAARELAAAAELFPADEALSALLCLAAGGG